MDFSIIVTFGPSIRSEEKLQAISSLGNCIFRINGAHARPHEIFIIAEYIKQYLPNGKVMVDLPGNKVRLAHLSQPLPITKGEKFQIHGSQLNYENYGSHLKLGDLALTHDSKYTLEVIDLAEQCITFLPHHSGTLQPNKGLHVQGANRTLPFLFEKDRELIKAACSAEVDYLSMSYVRTGKDIQEVKAILADSGKDLELISKIETEDAIEHLGDIFFEVDTINVDRGDLSADIGILRLPLVQERVIDSAKRAGKRVFLATQFLHNMEQNPVPLIPETIDLYNTIKTGVDGIQLSEETAVGRYPVECVKLVFDMYRKSFSSA